MKPHFLKILAIPLLLIIFSGCSSNNTDPEPTPVAGCSGNTFFAIHNVSNTTNPVLHSTFDVVDNNGAQPVVANSFQIIAPPYSTTDTTLNSIFMHGGTFSNGIFAIVDQRNQNLYKINTLGTVVKTATPSNKINAAIYLDNKLYFGQYSNADNTKFDILNDTYTSLATITVSPNYQNFGSYVGNPDTFSSATDGVNLYFLFGQNLITYNVAANTIVNSFFDTSQNVPDGCYIGVESIGGEKLLAMRFNNATMKTDLYELNVADPANVTKSVIISLGYHVNVDNYSTTYDDCSKRYYVSTGPGNVNSLTKVNLSGTPSVVTVNTSPNYWCGIAIKK